MTEPQSNLTSLAIRTLWLAAIAWLVLCNLSTVNFVALWFIEPANPLRHELIIGLSVSILLAGPAIFAVFVYCAFLSRFTRPIERRIGVALALSCVAIAATPWIIHT